MISTLLAAGSLFLLVAAGPPSHGGEVRAKKAVAPSETVIPAEIRMRSAVGEVLFHHQKHIKDLAINCVECHHQINAKKLDTPHPDYLKSSWISCKTCHDESGKVHQKVFACSACHRTNPRNIADETLSAKVVIHKKCWNCHAVGAGKDASRSCEKCHSGKKTL